MVPEATFLGEPYPQSFIHMIRVRDGKVILQREYFNSEILADAGAHRARQGPQPAAVAGPEGVPMSETKASDASANTADGFDFRRMTVPEAIRWLAEHGEPADPRSDIDPASLERRFPHLVGITTFDDMVTAHWARCRSASTGTSPLYRPLAPSSGFTAAGSSRQPRHAGVRLVRPRARCPRYPGRRCRLREVPGGGALSRPLRRRADRVAPCAPRLRGRAGHPARAARPRRSECRRGADGGRSSTAPGRGRAAACRSPPGLPAGAPEWPGGLRRGRPRVDARAARAEVRGHDERSWRIPRVRRTRGRTRVPVDTHRGLRTR